MMWIGILILSTAFARTLSDAVCASDLRTYDDDIDLHWAQSLYPGLRVLHSGPCYKPVQDIARWGKNFRQRNVDRSFWNNARHKIDRTSLVSPEESGNPSVSYNQANPGPNGGEVCYPINSQPGGPSYQPGYYAYNLQTCGFPGQPPCLPNRNQVYPNQLLSQLCQLCQSGVSGPDQPISLLNQFNPPAGFPNRPNQGSLPNQHNQASLPNQPVNLPNQPNQSYYYPGKGPAENLGVAPESAEGAVVKRQGKW